MGLLEPLYFLPLASKYIYNLRHQNRGTVKLFSEQKGLHFITPNDGGDEIFIYQYAIRSDCFRSLVDSEAIEFDVELGNACCTKSEDPVMVEVVGIITMVVVVDIDVEVGDMVVMKLFTVVAGYGGDGTYGSGGGKCGGGGGGGGGGGCSKCGEGGHLERECSKSW
ncbi:hypothetical protein H5410_063974 [Solanum commersonii]|uniref:CCHC-type domain-containing protein n=1 Tax=Solanum commersonii TaxID=4109 RepID=A0A9J5W1I6_SOLCO|nr:hypothetical protein H5410_063974 [Solanum commersonii]